MAAPGPYRVEHTPDDEVMVVDRDGRLVTYVFPDGEHLGNARLLAAAWDLRQAQEFDRDGPRLLEYAATLIERVSPTNPVVGDLRRRACKAKDIQRRLNLDLAIPVMPVESTETWRVKRSPWWRLLRSVRKR